ncbi:MAG: MATE family efflux transporter [Clostridia bacterium]|nr:MATE family efflux transporter [Clostridia bacterium]
MTEEKLKTPQKTKDKSEKMGTMPIGKLLFTMSVPAMISMLVQALYNIVDSVYVAQIPGFGAAPTDAVSIAFPFQMLVMAFALGIGVGGNSLIARYLGQGDKYSASKVASTGLVISIAHCLVFVVLGLTVVRPLAGLFTKSEQTVNMTVEYLSVCSVLSIFMYVEIYLNKVNQAMGRMIVPMIAQLIGAITNIILDPIFIFNMGMGVKGAAVATVIGQANSMVFTVIMFFAMKSEAAISPKYVRIKGKTLASIYKIGFPTIILNAVSSFTVMIMNFLFKLFDYAIGTTILGVYFKVQSFVFMPCFGLNQGLLPVLAYNYGANKKDRFMKAFKVALITAVSIMTVGLILFQTLSGTILSVFPHAFGTPEMKMQAVTAFRIISISFIPAAFCIITITMFQSIGYGFNSMLMSILRQLVILLPVAIFICLVFKAGYIWWAYPIAEIAVVAVFIPIAFKTISKVFAIKATISQQENVNAA